MVHLEVIWAYLRQTTWDNNSTLCQLSFKPLKLVLQKQCLQFSLLSVRRLRPSSGVVIAISHDHALELDFSSSGGHGLCPALLEGI